MIERRAPCRNARRFFYVLAYNGKAVKANGQTAALLQSAMELPADSLARQLAETLLAQQEHALTELGLEIEDQNLPRAEQLALIEQTTEQVLTDQTLGELARLVEQDSLTDALGHGKVVEKSRIDARDRLDNIFSRSTTKIRQGICAFSPEDPLYRNVQEVKPDGDKFDVAMHGAPTTVAFGGRDSNMSPRTLAAIIRHSEGYHGQDIRLLSCSTGVQVDGNYCFAEELANALGVTVWAPSDVLYIAPNGSIKVGKYGSGKFITYGPNERRRIK